jgi:DNA ligase (NAD+)
MVEPQVGAGGHVGGGLELDADQRRRVAELAERLSLYRARYYAGEPMVSDAAYDALEDELRRLDPTHPLLGRIGSPVLVEAWDKARHEIPMGSLNKVVSVEELHEWVARCDELLGKEGEPPIDSELFVAEKLDGISVELLYRQGKLSEGITRGDGETGERITPNVARMRGVPPTIRDARPLSVRGEIILRLSDMREHFPGVTSPRNAAAGTARRFDGQGNEHLTVLVYDLAGEPALATEREKFELLRQLGFATPRTYLGSVQDVLDCYRDYAEGLRQSLDYEIDGLVVRSNRLATQALLGEVNHRPRGAVAFKFASPSKVSRVVEIRWETGASGRVTPVAVVEPVTLAGATVQRASLHNAGLVRMLGIGVGDEVLVSRRNDVIPYVEEVVVKHGDPTAAPSHCGRCAHPLQVEGEYLFCRNAECPALVEGRIRNWIDAVGVLEWGDKLVELLVERGRVREPLDLYSLSVDDVASLEHEGRKKGRKIAEKALSELRARMPLSLPVFLAALGIEGFGLQTARLLVAAGYRELGSLLRAGEDELAAIHGLGAIKAASIVRGLRARAGEIERLLAAGISPAAVAEAGPLAGKTFCITGTLSRPRKELQGLIEQQGGRMLASVTRGLDYLVIADPASTSSKAVKARRYGTQLLGEAELMALLTG